MLSTQRRYQWAILLGLPMALMWFQNCGAPLSLEATPDGAGDSEVRLVDDWRSEKIMFLSSEVVVAADEGATEEIVGWCHRDTYGKAIHWQVVDAEVVQGFSQVSGSQSEAASGASVCERGGFQVVLPDLPEEACEQTLLLRARDEAGAGAQVPLKLRCAETAVQEG